MHRENESIILWLTSPGHPLQARLSISLLFNFNDAHQSSLRSTDCNMCAQGIMCSIELYNFSRVVPPHCFREVKMKASVILTCSDTRLRYLLGKVRKLKGDPLWDEYLLFLK